MKRQIEEFRPYVSVIQALRHPGMKARHYEMLTEQTGIETQLTTTLTFKTLISAGIMNFHETVKEVSETAAKEYTIEGSLDKMIREWDNIKMDVIPHKDTGD